MDIIKVISSWEDNIDHPAHKLSERQAELLLKHLEESGFAFVPQKVTSEMMTAGGRVLSDVYAMSDSFTAPLIAQEIFEDMLAASREISP